MNLSTQSAAPIYSPLAEDPELSDLVAMFVEEMPERLAQLTRARDANNWAEVSLVAHQLKGASGSYGFHLLTTVAGNLETAIVRRQSAEEILRAISELVETGQRIQPGPAR